MAAIITHPVAASMLHIASTIDNTSTGFESIPPTSLGTIKLKKPASRIAEIDSWLTWPAASFASALLAKNGARRFASTNNGHSA
ncbi:hypothetical protein GGR39_002258 [Novosphingobium fluoreni]|uniref:Uncharacterized protein n=1 Tax=Novosphingobium fluoreni TaxID=1391222 RepID=A0A7W6C6U9_9SPHN|nr:hypothetical protein [Novosphingobium fluoreni]MBB3940601.1 hypothetical protein [Novosphingobium fluoreni]